MISQQPCLLVFCNSDLENKSSPGSMMDREAIFCRGKTQL